MPGLGKITANSMTWFLGQMLNKGSGLVLVLVAARIMGEDMFGKYTVVMAYYVIFNVLIDFGLRPLMIREVARSQDRANSYLWCASFVKVIIHLTCLLLLLLILWISGTPRLTALATILAVVALLPFSLSQTLSSMYLALERMYYEALIVTIGQLLWVVTVIVMLMSGYGLISLFVALNIVNLIVFLMNIIVFTRRFFRPRFEFDGRLIRQMLRDTLPFALTSAFAILYFRVDTIMLSWMRGDVEVSWYGLAYRVTDTVNFVPIALMVSLYPIISRLYLTNQQTMRVLVERTYYYLFLIGVPMSAGLSLSAEKLINLFFAATFRPTISALSLLSWSLAPLFLNSILITTMNSANRQHRVTRVTLYSLAVNILGNLVAIPLAGLHGACLTTIISELVILVVLQRELTQTINIHFCTVKELLSPIVATLVMSVSFLFFSELSLFLLLPLSALIFLVVVLITGGINRSDLVLFKQALLEKSTTTLGEFITLDS
ncbi:flippase [bacterium]|nr:flippase [bacterium]